MTGKTFNFHSKMINDEYLIKKNDFSKRKYLKTLITRDVTNEDIKQKEKWKYEVKTRHEWIPNQWNVW